MNKQQFKDLRELLVRESATNTIIPAVQTLLGIDPRNPTHVTKLLTDLKLGDISVDVDGNAYVVTVAGHIGRHGDQTVAFLRALVAAIEAKALDALFPEKKTGRSTDTAKTPERGFTRPMGRR